ncbi:hypothetical protein B0H16DRAFT_995082 [Mycena metata]|uniref:Uncharacterized protein n=1 Tax=Mycena metata TaxID=1033252 RepID=A0AAD7N304_9AGAR|nr:hypothetical protein B0H16DRAFT_995082 [Mycena metata]
MATADHVQRSVAANQVPDEIISEILSPLLKLSDEVFSERSEKVLLDPGYSCSTYLLVCKAWLRVSTPLLYNVVILRTTAQAVALQKALEVSPEIGGFIKKLRVEGGYGAAMHTILKCAPNITDLFISLFIHGTDSTKGLCSGLPLIDPRRVILHDASNPDEKPKKNKQVTQLFETLLVVVTKWKNLKIFDFPYLPAWPQGDVPVSDPRAETLASALVKSKSLEVLIVSVERTFCHEFPGYLRQVVNATALKSLRITGYLRLVDDMRRLVVELKDPRLEALIEWAPFPPPDQGIEILSPSPSPPPGAPDTVEDLPSLKTMGQTSGATLREITVYLNGLQGSSLKSKPVDPNVLVPFTALTKLRWTTWGPYRKLSFANPPRNFSALENLQIMVVRGQSPSLLDISLKLPYVIASALAPLIFFLS